MRSRLSVFPEARPGERGLARPLARGRQRQDPAPFPRRAAGRESGAEAGGSGLHGQFFSVVLIQLEDCKEFSRMIQDKD
jgi:hypothetical protein